MAVRVSKRKRLHDLVSGEGGQRNGAIEFPLVLICLTFYCYCLYSLCAQVLGLKGSIRVLCQVQLLL